MTVANETSTFDFAKPALKIPSWVAGPWPRRFQYLVFQLVFLASFLVVLGSGVNIVLGYVGFVAIYFASVVVHELGHWIGARAGGMQVIGAQLSWIQLWRTRKGFRARWSRPRHVAGWVMAVDPSGNATKAGTTAFVIGGPVANVVLIGIGLAGMHIDLGFGWFALTALNLGLLVITLVPHYAATLTDGLRLIALLRGKRVSVVADLAQHIISRSVTGRIDIPKAELDLLLQEPGVGGFFARYLALCQHVRAHLDDEAREFGAQAQATFDALSKAEKTAATPIMTLIRFELASMDRDAERLVAIRLDADTKFRAPYLMQRREALLALIRDDVAGAEQALAKHELLSEQSIDAGARASERAWRERMRATLGVSK